MSGGRARTIRPDLLFAVAGGAALFLSAALAVELHDGLGATEAAPAMRPVVAGALHGSWEAGDASTAISALPSAAAVDEDTRVVLARPVFSPGRRPPSVAVAGPEQPRLAGIIAGPAGRRAIFAGDGDARGTVVGVGGHAGVWRVLAIEDHAVRVDGPDGVRLLHPARDKTGSAGSDAPTLPGTDGIPHPSLLDLLRSRNGAGGGGLMGGQLPLPRNGGQFPQQTAPAAPE